MHDRDVDEEDQQPFQLDTSSSPISSSPVSSPARRYRALPVTPSYTPFAVNPLYTKVCSSLEGRPKERRSGDAVVTAGTASPEGSLAPIKEVLISFTPLQSPPPIRLFRAFYGIGFDGSNLPVMDLLVKANLKLERRASREEHIDAIVPSLPAIASAPNERSEMEADKRTAEDGGGQLTRSASLMKRKSLPSCAVEKAVFLAHEGIEIWEKDKTTTRLEEQREGETQEAHSRGGASLLLEAYARHGMVLQWQTTAVAGLSRHAAPTRAGESCPTTGHPDRDDSSSSGSRDLPLGCSGASPSPEFSALPFPSTRSPIAVVACSSGGGSGDGEEERSCTWGITVDGGLYYHVREQPFRFTNFDANEALCSSFSLSSPTTSTTTPFFSSPSSLLPRVDFTTSIGSEETTPCFRRFQAVEKPIRMISAGGGTVFALSGPLSSFRCSPAPLSISSTRVGAPHPSSSVKEEEKEGEISASLSSIVYCWGDNRYGQCMRDPCLASFIAVPRMFRPSAIGVCSLTCGGSYGILVFEDGVMGVWGATTAQWCTASSRGIPTIGHNQLHGSGGGEKKEEEPSKDVAAIPRVVLQPVPLRLPHRVVRVSTGPAHAAALTEKGEVWTWGVGKRGRLGHGGESDEARPRCIEEKRWMGNTIRCIACGEQHTAALTSEGRLWLWGDNTYGQLGDAAGRHGAALSCSELWEGSPIPWELPWTHAIPVIAVVCGGTYTLMLLADGEIIGCGVLKVVMEPIATTTPETRAKLSFPPVRCPPRRLLPDFLAFSLGCGKSHAVVCGMPRQLVAYVIWGGGGEAGWEHRSVCPWKGDQTTAKERAVVNPIKEGLAFPSEWSNDRPCRREGGIVPFSSCCASTSPLPSWRQAAGGRGFFVFLSRDGRRIVQLTLSEDRRWGSVSPPSTRAKEEQGVPLCVPSPLCGRDKETLLTKEVETNPLQAGGSLPFCSSSLNDSTRKTQVSASEMHEIFFPSDLMNAYDKVKAERVEAEGKQGNAVVVNHISCGPDYTIAVTTTGKAFGWRNHWYEERREACNLVFPFPFQSAASPLWIPMYDNLPPSLRITQVACGATFVVVLLENGMVYEHGCACCAEEKCTREEEGKDGEVKERGEVGLPAVEDPMRTAPRRVRGFCQTPPPLLHVEEEEEMVVMVAAGHSHAMALSSRGELFAWGRGVLGHGPPFAASRFPRKILLPRFSLGDIPSSAKQRWEMPIRSIACGPFNSLVLLENGDLLVWGCNQFGQCGFKKEGEQEGRKVTGIVGRDHARPIREVVPTPVKIAANVKSAAFSAQTLVVVLEGDGSLAISGRTMLKAYRDVQPGRELKHSRMSVSSFFSLTRLSLVSYGLLHPLFSSATPLPTWPNELPSSSLFGIVCFSGYEGVVILAEANRPKEDDVCDTVIRLHRHPSYEMACREIRK